MDNPTKLLLAEISQELDGYDSDDGENPILCLSRGARHEAHDVISASSQALARLILKLSLSSYHRLNLMRNSSPPTKGNDSFTDACGADRLAFASCEDFAREFDRLYEGRDTSLYPHPNPMRDDLLVAPVDSYTVNFPVRYNFEQSVHGVDHIQFVLPSAMGKVQVVSDGMCLEAGGSDSLRFADCQVGLAIQDFTRDMVTLQIKHGGKCVDHNPTTNVVYLSAW